jgi:predicted enzyme related to lactoylglutathione lyase
VDSFSSLTFKLVLQICSLVFLQTLATSIFASVQHDNNPGIAVGPQYDSTHIYVAPEDLNVFVNSFIATFGGQASKPIITKVTPSASRTTFRYIMSPVGMLSVFAYETPIPFPFGQEHYGYLITDMDQAIKKARAVGAEIVVEPFKDPIGRDAIIQWNGSPKLQLYWHFSPPSYASLKSIPDHRVYVSNGRADEFVHNFVRFSHGKIVEDNKNTNGKEIGRPDYTFRRLRIESPFGHMQVMVTDGHLPYPFGYDTTGYQVDDLAETLIKAKHAGAKILSKPLSADDRHTAILQFPGGYIAEVHDLKKPSS